MATTYDIRPIAPVVANEAFRFGTYPAHAGEDFKKGTPVTLGLTGTITEVNDDATTGILGFTLAGTADYVWMDDTFGIVNPMIPVAYADQVFRGTLEGTYDADGHIGVDFALHEDATGFWTVDETNETNISVLLIGVDDGVVDGDINVPCTFVVISTAQQLSL